MEGENTSIREKGEERERKMEVGEPINAVVRNPL
jgi:hypothetical protein